jgi:hypothetical protein
MLWYVVKFLEHSSLLHKIRILTEHFTFIFVMFLTTDGKSFGRYIFISTATKTSKESIT